MHYLREAIQNTSQSDGPPEIPRREKATLVYGVSEVVHNHLRSEEAFQGSLQRFLEYG